MPVASPTLDGCCATDPLIVHVPDADAAVKLAVFASPEEERAFRCLADAFWPGPLTMVVKACDAIPLKGGLSSHSWCCESVLVPTLVWRVGVTQLPPTRDGSGCAPRSLLSLLIC